MRAASAKLGMSGTPSLLSLAMGAARASALPEVCGEAPA